jgi:hypothetical protein
MGTEAYEYSDLEVEKKEVDEDLEGKEEKEQDDVGDQETFDQDEDVDPALSKAEEDGWVPKEDWKGNPKDWVDYREFNIRGELMTRIKSQSHQLHTLMGETKDLKDALQVLGEHNKKTAEREYNRAIKTLKAERRDAREANDYEALDEIEDQIDELTEAKKDLDVEETSKDTKNVGPTPEQKAYVQNWIEKPENKWYIEDKALTAAADSFIWEYAQSHPNDLEGAIGHMEKQMRKRFPEETGDKQFKRGSATTETDGRTKGKTQRSNKKFTQKDLTEEQRRVGKTFVDQGVFDSIQEWVEELAKNGDLEA